MATWGKSEGDTCWLGGITAVCVTFGLISSEMLDFIFQAGKVCDGRSTGSSGVHGDKTCRELLSSVQTPVSWWWLWRQIQAAEADEPRVPPPPSSHRGFPSIPRCLQPRSICSTCFYFSRAAVFRPVRCLPHDSPCFPPLSCSQAPQIRHIPPSTGKNCLLFVAE